MKVDPTAPYQNPEKVMRAFITTQSASTNNIDHFELADGFDDLKIRHTRNQFLYINQEGAKTTTNLSRDHTSLSVEPNLADYKHLPLHLRAIHIAQEK